MAEIETQLNAGTLQEKKELKIQLVLFLVPAILWGNFLL